MSASIFFQQQQHAHHGAAAHMQPSNNHHGGRSRRGPKMAAQNAQRQFRGVKSMRELAEAPAVTAFRARFEAGRSFDLDDDLEFCPSLLTEDDSDAFDFLRATAPAIRFLHFHISDDTLFFILRLGKIRPFDLVSFWPR
ncbi:unnamed protein product [Aspergillus oryzae RIB40]|uniref:DNA, SC012 n=2 Tax=Aspergillus oryzae TaxID=5062 RepID=Q2UDB3_ASPOR|nr:unnamed protein product [Aspergillus oryzae RIB40]EIT76119.1 hypothetical protein Ao3042_07917 [Aspergillus oryzae 3.042]KDE76472.1 hypothetical protein AO1008_02245 [Aspergillus oryzae 100-8]BAE60452.1 unnamed protein product [Aspergillus oryzae RIB40]|eukprot:EIT76119.1 hypothetical protein Ao3042_07917 [Aspergillus oryzae 3.042]